MDNPILEVYKGVEIRRYNKIQCRVTPFEYKKIIDAKVKFGLSARAVIAISGKPCERCKGVNVSMLDDNGEWITIPRGILKPKDI